MLAFGLMGKDNVPVVAMLGRVSEVEHQFTSEFVEGEPITVPSVRGPQADSRDVWYQNHEEIRCQGCYQ
jgi:hypothetical protein